MSITTSTVSITAVPFTKNVTPNSSRHIRQLERLNEVIERDEVDFDLIGKCQMLYAMSNLALALGDRYTARNYALSIEEIITPTINDFRLVPAGDLNARQHTIMTMHFAALSQIGYQRYLLGADESASLRDANRALECLTQLDSKSTYTTDAQRRIDHLNDLEMQDNPEAD